VARRGIDNVLGSLIGSPEPETAAKAEPKEQVREAAAAMPTPSPTPPPESEKPKSPSTRPRAARRGRPPGSKAGEGGNKVKKTFAIDSDLYDACVSRSWKEEMQMGEVIEKALRLYLKTPVKQAKE
jgi:hypothetical protein